MAAHSCAFLDALGREAFAADPVRQAMAERLLERIIDIDFPLLTETGRPGPKGYYTRSDLVSPALLAVEDAKHLIAYARQYLDSALDELLGAFGWASPSPPVWSPSAGLTGGGAPLLNLGTRRAEARTPSHGGQKQRPGAR